MEEGYIERSGLPIIKSNLGVGDVSKRKKGPTKKVGIQIQAQG